jgi:hypothetical protein
MALSHINPSWTDEQLFQVQLLNLQNRLYMLLFQETRRILIAKLQHVVYSEWLPVVLGCEVMARYL